MGDNPTAGPWRTGSGGCHIIGANRVDGKAGMRKIAQTYSNEETIDYKEQFANSKLIAASPDLLDACEKMFESFEPAGGWEGKAREALFACEAAIAKAREKRT